MVRFRGVGRALLVVFASAILMSCGGGGGGGSSPSASDDPGAYTQDTDQPPMEVAVAVEDNNSTLTPAARAVDGYDTVVVKSTDTYAIDESATDSDTLVLSGTGLPTLAAGDVVVGVASDGQSGYLRKIVSGADGTYTTAPATLEEAFPDADLNLSLSFANSNERGARAASLDVLSFDRHLEHQFVDGVNTVLDLGMESSLDVDLELRILRASIEKFRTVANASMTANAYFNVDIPYEYSRQYTKQFNALFNKNTVVTIGAVPVLVNIRVVPVAGADLDLSAAASLRYGYEFSGSTQAGFDYYDGQMNTVANFVPTTQRIGPDYTLEGAANLKGRVSLAVQVSFYETSINIPVYGAFEIDGPGIGIDLGPYAQFAASVAYDNTAEPPMSCLLDLSVGVSSDLSVDYGSIGSTLNVSNPGPLTLYDASSSLWSSSTCPFDDNRVGALEGQVTDSGNNALLGINVTVTDRGNDENSHTLQTDAAGAFSFAELGVGSYEVAFSGTGYDTVTGIVQIIADQTSHYPQVMVLTDEQVGADGSLVVTVVDAQDPTTGLSGARILVREGLNAPSGAYVTSFTSGGSVELPAGHYTLEVSFSGYETTYQSVAIEANGAQNLSIPLSADSDDSSVGGTGGEARVVLTWGANPSDLDSHLVHGSDHVFYSNPDAPGINLDVDDITSYGPETVTVDSVDTGSSYGYYVHHFSGDGTLATSSATVKLYYGGTMRTYYVPSGTGRYWQVFDIVNGTVVPCSSGCLTDSAPRAGKVDRLKPYQSDMRF